MRGLPLLFALRLRRTWNFSVLLGGMILLVALTYLEPKMEERSLLWILYVTGLLSLQFFTQLQQLQTMPFARMLPRNHRAEAGALGLVGVVLVGLVALWQATVPHPLPLPSALGAAIAGYAMGMSPLSIIVVLAGVMGLHEGYVDRLLAQPWLVLAASLALSVGCVVTGAKRLGLRHPGDFRGAPDARVDLRGWRAKVAAVLFRHPVRGSVQWGRNAWTLADALAYEDAPLRSGLRRWWTLPAVMLVVLAMGLVLGLQGSDYGFMVMFGSVLVFYIGSKLNVIVPPRRRVYPVSRRLLLQACWLAHLKRMLGLAALWGAMLWLFCTVVSRLYPNTFGDMPGHYPLYLAAVGALLPMPVAQGFAVHYGGDYNQQAAVAERRFLRSVLFTVCELSTVAAFATLLVMGLFWPPLKVAGILALLFAVTQAGLWLSMRRDLLRGDLA